MFASLIFCYSAKGRRTYASLFACLRLLLAHSTFTTTNSNAAF